MRRATVFILSDVRSGTTLLDQCLGANDCVTSLGEVHWLRAYMRQDRSLYDPVHPLECSCGLPVPACPFWTSVQKTLRRPLDGLQLHSNFAQRREAMGLAARLRFLPRRLVRSRPRSYRIGAVRSIFGGRRLARDCNALYDAVAASTGRPYCVDSSKSPFRFRAVYEADPSRTRAIVLARDYRAVVHSKMRRGESMESAAAGWNRAMNQIEALTGDLTSSRVLKLTYESLCERPEIELRRVCSFLGLEFSEQMLERPTTAVHHIGGSPSKFDARRIAISLDQSHEGAFEAGALERMRSLVAESADRWGY